MSIYSNLQDQRNERKRSKSLMMLILTSFATILFLASCISMTIESYQGNKDIIQISFVTPSEYESNLPALEVTQSVTKSSPGPTIPTTASSLTVEITPSSNLGVEQLTHSNGIDYEPSFSPGGEKLVFISDRDGNPEVYIINFDGTEEKRLTFTTNVKEDLPVFSPDGTKIIFGGDNSHDEEIYLMNADGSQLKNITMAGDSNERRPTIVPLGYDLSLVFFESDKSHKRDIFSAPLRGEFLGAWTNLTNDKLAFCVHPLYAPALDRILFRGRGVEENFISHVYQIDSNGGDFKQIETGMPDDLDIYNPIVSTDGKWLLFVTDVEADDIGEIYYKDFSAEKSIQINNIESFRSGVAISPDTKWIVFSTKRYSQNAQLFKMPFQPNSEISN